MVLGRLKEAAEANFETFVKIVRMMQDVEIPGEKAEGYAEEEIYSESELVNEEEEANMETASYAIVKMKGHLSLMLSIVQVSFLVLFNDQSVLPLGTLYHL